MARLAFLLRDDEPGSGQPQLALALVRELKKQRRQKAWSMFRALFLSSFLVTASVFIHYETLRFLSVYVPTLKVAVRLKVLVVVLGCFLAHTMEVWLYALAYFLIDQTQIGSLKGEVEGHFADYLYFSATSYSTLGFGDVYPTGALRLISGIEGVNGLFLIAWSTSFTYFVMHRLWPLHSDRTDDDKKH